VGAEMRGRVQIALAIVGVLAGLSAAAAPLAFAHDGKVPRCIKWKKVHGKRVCVKRAKPKPKPATTTTTEETSSGPVFAEGHYSANTTQNSTLQFDLTSDVASFFQIGELDVTCDPGGFLSGFHPGLGGALLVDENGKFNAAFPISFAGGGSGTVTLDGVVTQAGTVSGTFSANVTYVSDGVAITCSSGTVQWSGGTGASAPAPPAGPQLGHYAGTTAQNSAFRFDVVTEGGYLYITQLAIDEVDVSCSADYTGYSTGLYFADGLFFVNASGHFHYVFHASDGSRSFVLEGAIDGAGHASGTVSRDFTLNGISCRSGAVAWTATHA
jgi:hypothetical protein